MFPLSPGHYRDSRERAGISKSWVSRQFIEASTQELEPLEPRRFDDLELLIIHPGWLVFGENHVIGTVDVRSYRENHVLGLAEVPSESAAAVTSLLENLVDQKVTPIVVTCPSSRAPRPGGPGAVGHEWAYG